jgi:hypothetical protein
MSGGFYMSKHVSIFCGVAAKFASTLVLFEVKPWKLFLKEAS